VPSPGFVAFGPDGLAPMGPSKKGYVRLDLERQWILIRSLLLSEKANVQWLFIERSLEALLTEYARAKGEPAELLWRAETVMRQPSDGQAHDDHMHLRTACLPDEALAGCEGGGPYWPWLPRLPALEPDMDGASLAAEAGPIEPYGVTVAKAKGPADGPP
jgi:penicillin-insensitive murein endopeptidase